MKIPAVFFRILDFIYDTTIGFDKQNKNWEVWHKKVEIWNKSWKEKKVRKVQKSQFEFFFSYNTLCGNVTS